MITRVNISGYKSLSDVEISFHPLTVVMGPNAAGKSNLFDVLGLLSRMVTKRNLKEAFEDHRGTPLEAFSVGSEGIEGMLRKPTAEFCVEVDVQLSPGVVETLERTVNQMREGLPVPSQESGETKRRIREHSLRYMIRIQLLTSTGHLRVLDEKLQALNPDGTEDRKRRPFLEKIQNRLHLRMEGQAHPVYHQMGLDHTIISTPLYPPHYPHITAFREELSRWRFYYLEPKSLMRSENPLKEVESLSQSGEDLAAYFNTLQAKNPAQFDTLARTISTLLPSIDSLTVEKTKQGFLQLRLVENGVPFSARVLSEGTLRVLGLLAITNPLAPTTLIGYEEPENGVHSKRLQLVASLLKNAVRGKETQILVNTHSPILPQYFDERSLLVCKKLKRRTVFEPFATRGPLFKPGAIDKALEEEEEATLTERIVRGDFGG